MSIILVWYSSSRLLRIHMYPSCYYPILRDVIRPHLLLLARIAFFLLANYSQSLSLLPGYYLAIIPLVSEPLSQPLSLLFSHYFPIFLVRLITCYYFPIILIILLDKPISVIVHVVVTHPVARKPGKLVGFLLIGIRSTSYPTIVTSTVLRSNIRYCSTFFNYLTIYYSTNHDICLTIMGSTIIAIDEIDEL